MKRLVSGLVLSTIAFTPPLFAQNDVLEEIIVTSQRREQSMQDVPVAVTAFTAEAIQRQNITAATDYLALTPNVSYTEDGQFGKRGAGIAVRGINNLVSGENASVPSIGVYLDGFSIASVPNQFSNPQIPDMQRIEVLRGPQGTFFGRNAVGGALNLTTRKPELGEFTGEVWAGAENYEDAGEQYSIGGVLNIPVSDTFALRGVLNYEDNSGWVSNICRAGAPQANCPAAAENNFTPNGAPDSGHENTSLRLRGLWDVSDRTEILASLIYAREDQGHDENVPSGFLDIDTTETLGITEALDPGTGFWDTNQNQHARDLDEFNETETIIGIFDVQHDFSDQLHMVWISGFIDSEFNRLFEQDLIGGADTLLRRNTYDGTSWSSEFRLEFSSDTFQWIAGAMISNDDQNQRNNVAISSNATATINGIGWLPPFPEGLGLALNEKSFEIEGIALFADFTWRVSENLEFILGGRYSHDEVTTDLTAFGIAPGPNSCDPGVDIVCFFMGFENFARPPVSGYNSFDDIAPRVGFRYDVNDDVNIYGIVSKGYKAGGNSIGNDTNNNDALINVPYDEETLWNIELGFKSMLAGNRLRFNAALFMMQWEDMQFEAFRFLTPGDLSSNFERTINIVEATAAGFEAEFTWLVTENFTLSGSLGILDTEIDDPQPIEITGGYQVVLDGLEIPKAPETMYNLAAEYRFPLADSEPWIRVEFIHRDGQYSDIEGLTNQQTTGPAPASGLSRVVDPGQFPYLSPDFDVVNVRAGWDWERFSVIGYVQNATDEEYYTGTQENFGASGIRLRPHPRIFGLRGTFRF
ncbi:MAG: TonB-dependent receptor [Gammaproteobacteria bacterium]|nr:TonB-dependent receptor [Gammaproteobacteria bacterium]